MNRDPLLGRRNSDDETPMGKALTCLGCFSITVVLVFFSTIGSITATEYGLVRNTLTGSIDTTHVYSGGRHFLGPISEFLVYPSTLQTLRLSHFGDADPVKTRTGGDPQDPDSGGQPITVSAAFQFRFVKKLIPKVYTSFATLNAAKLRYELLGRNVISNTAQLYTPQDFWIRRKAITEEIRSALNTTIYNQGYAEVQYFELIRVDFAEQYENTITAIQVAEQQKVIQEYEQKVATVSNRITVLKAENDAAIQRIEAAGTANATVTKASARQEAFSLVQHAQATGYKTVFDRLGLTTPEERQRYLEIKALSKSPQLVIGLDKACRPGSAPVKP